MPVESNETAVVVAHKRKPRVRRAAIEADQFISPLKRANPDLPGLPPGTQDRDLSIYAPVRKSLE